MQHASNTPSSTTYTLSEGALNILIESNAMKKVLLSQDLRQNWRERGGISIGFAEAPTRPSRPNRPKLLPPKDMPRRRPNSKKGRLALMHAIAHIELNAIDLAWDLIIRFRNENLPKEFYDDWVEVGADEARHFLMLQEYLEQHGSYYGDLPAHDGLWEAAECTSDDILARLAIVPLVLEARALDTTPGIITKLKAAGDDNAASIIEIIAQEEIKHVAAGVKWFDHICDWRGINPAKTFQNLVRQRFKGILKRPLSIDARSAAGFPQEYYTPLVES